MTATLPEVLPGHWTTADGREMAARYAAQGRDSLGMPDRTDLALANDLYMADGFLPLQTAAKERMRWLSVHLARAQIALRALQEASAVAMAAAAEGDPLADFLACVHRTAAGALALEGETNECDDAESCIACAVVIVDDDMVLPDASGGWIHAACCGPERESYVDADGEPLGPDDPIPTGTRWGDLPQPKQAADATAAHRTPTAIGELEPVAPLRHFRHKLGFRDATDTVAFDARGRAWLFFRNPKIRPRFAPFYTLSYAETAECWLEVETPAGGG